MADPRRFTAPEDRLPLDAALDDLIAGKAPFEVEHRIVRPGDGCVRIIRSLAEVVLDEAGVPVKVVGTLQDITDLRQVEERLRLIEYSIDHATDSLLWTDAKGRVVWFNEPTCATFGYTREELLGLTLFDLDPQLSEDTWDRVWRRMKSEGGFTFEVVQRKKNGDTFPVEISVNYVAYEGREFNCAVARDISERKRMEERATWLSRILDDSHDEVYVFDAETLRFVQVNKGAQRNLGYTMTELAEMTPLDLKPASTADAFDELVAPLRGGAEEQVIFFTEHRRKDGSVYPVEAHLQLAELERRPVFVAIILDITARRAAEEALASSEERLRQSQKMEAIGQLAGGIAHDFNNLLTAILGYTDILLASSTGDNGTLRDDLEEIRHAAERAGTLTRQILAFSRRQPLRPQVVSLNEVLTGMEALLQRSLGEDIELEWRLEPDLGPVEVDRHHFEQVFLNLAVNARDAMPVGGRLGFVTANLEIDDAFISTHPEFTPGRYVTVSVTDTGVGMDETTLAHAFEPFFTTKEAGKGTGLGLSTVYGIVRQSGGHITLESSLGEGSTFTVYLPRVSSAPLARSEPSGATHVASGGETVLVVEDEPALRSLVARVLGGLGHKVIVAASGAEALEILQQLERPPDLLLTDVVLPGGMQGNELADMLRPSLPGLPVLFMSGYPRDTIMRGGRIDEGLSFLQKPFTPAKLAEAVRETLDTRVGGW
jgi:PAS domain S-box-containing protein